MDEIIKKLNAVDVGYTTGDQFLNGTPTYKFNLDEKTIVYFSYTDFQTGENLEKKDIISLFVHRGKMRYCFLIINEMITDLPFIKSEVNYHFNNLESKL